MLVSAKKGPATYADIEALPEHVVGEILDGELIVSPRPASPHAVAASQLGVDLAGPFGRQKGGPGGWVILDEPELHFGLNVIVPDLAGWRRERMPQVPSVPFFELPPDWLCEVVSPPTARIDRTRKMRHYARARVQHIWLVDPLATTLEVFRLDGDGWRLVDAYGGDAKVRPEPFDAVELDLTNLWSR
ncbi:MAG: Uma2 family endonuclease [Polyangia bacterium]